MFLVVSPMVVACKGPFCHQPPFFAWTLTPHFSLLFPAKLGGQFWLTDMLRSWGAPRAAQRQTPDVTCKLQTW